MILFLIPDYFVRFVLWLFTHTLYRIQIVGEQNIPQRGPALLVSNHVSFVDALLIGASMPHFVRFMLHRDYYDLKSLNWFFRLMHSIPVSATNRREIVESLKRARNELDKGHVVCIFAEGAICRTGHLLPFKRGFEKIVEGKNIPIIPVHLDQLWGSVFSFKEGRFFWKWPKKFSYPVTVSFGAPLRSAASVNQVRNAVLELESDAFAYRRSAGDLLHARFIEVAKRHWFSFCMADTTGTELTYGKTLIGALLLARWVKKNCPTETTIGVILPASVAGSLVNIAILLAGESEFYRRQRVRGFGRRPMSYQDNRYVSGFLEQGKSRNRRRHGVSRRNQKDIRSVGQNAWNTDSPAAPALVKAAIREKPEG